MKTIIAICTILLMSSVMGVAIASHFEANPAPFVAGLFIVLTFVAAKTPAGVLGLNHADLTKETTDNMGGIGEKFYWALAADVLTWPTIASLSTATDYTEAGKVTGNFAMKPGKRFFEGYSTLDTGGLDSKMQGGLDCHSYKNEFSISAPGMKNKLLGFMRATQNENLVFIVPDAELQYRVVGSEQFPAKPEKGEGSSGKVAADSKKADLGFFAYSNGPAPVYTGTIPLTVAGSGSGA